MKRRAIFKTLALLLLVMALIPAGTVVAGAASAEEEHTVVLNDCDDSTWVRDNVYVDQTEFIQGTGSIRAEGGVSFFIPQDIGRGNFPAFPRFPPCYPGNCVV